MVVDATDGRNFPNWIQSNPIERYFDSVARTVSVHACHHVSASVSSMPTSIKGHGLYNITPEKSEVVEVLNS